jgi:hypothetical protein
MGAFPARLRASRIACNRLFIGASVFSANAIRSAVTCSGVRGFRRCLALIRNPSSPQAIAAIDTPALAL